MINFVIISGFFVCAVSGFCSENIGFYRESFDDYGCEYTKPLGVCSAEAMKEFALTSIAEDMIAAFKCPGEDYSYEALFGIKVAPRVTALQEDFMTALLNDYDLKGSANAVLALARKRECCGLGNLGERWSEKLGFQRDVQFLWGWRQQRLYAVYTLQLNIAMYVSEHFYKENDEIVSSVKAVMNAAQKDGVQWYNSGLLQYAVLKLVDGGVMSRVSKDL